MSAGKKCRQCSADAEVKALERVEGEESGARATIEGLPAMVCLSGHRRFITPDFPVLLVKRVLKADGVFGAPQAVKKGLFKKHLLCPGCGSELVADSSSHTGARVQMEFDAAEPFSVTVALPLHRCQGCGKEATQPREDMEAPVMKAVANAFRAAEIPPG